MPVDARFRLNHFTGPHEYIQFSLLCPSNLKVYKRRMTPNSKTQELSAAIDAQRISIAQIDVQLANPDLDEAIRDQLLDERESLGLTYVLGDQFADD